jgi:hypothetical protein
MPDTCDCQVISGPAYITCPEAGTIFVKGDITITAETTPTSIVVDAYGETDKRVNSVRHTISFTPTGTRTEISGFIGRYADVATEYKPGQSMFGSTSANITAIADGTSSTTLLTMASNTGFFVGQWVTVAGTSVAGYIGTWKVTALVSTTQIKIAVAYTSAGTGTGTVARSNSLTIHPVFENGGVEKIIRFQNVALTTLPNLNFNSTESPLGAVTYTAIRAPGSSATDTESVMVFSTWSAPTAPAGYDPNDIMTEPPKLRYGAASANAWTSTDPVAAPWNSFCTMDGAVLSFNLSTQDRITDGCGLVNIIFSDLTVSATAKPIGSLMTHEAVQKVLQQQGMTGWAGRVRGQSMKAGTPLMLWIKLEGVNQNGGLDIKIPSTAAAAAPTTYGTQSIRNGDLVWQGLRTFTSGVRQPLFSIVTP